MAQYQSIYNGTQIDDCVSQAVRTIVQQLTDAQKEQVRTNIGAGTYSIPNGGIPITSLTTDVQTSLSKADNALPLSGGTISSNKRDILKINDTSGGGAYTLYDGVSYFGYNKNNNESFIGCDGYWFHIYKSGYTKIEEQLYIDRTLSNYSGSGTNLIYPLVINFTPSNANDVQETSIQFRINDINKGVVGAYNDGVFMYNYSSGNNVHLNNSGYFVTPSRLSVGAGDSPSYMLHVAGTVGSTGYVNYSDVRKKEILDNVNIDIRYIADTPIFKYTWLDKRMGQDVNVGTSAQYWKMILPEIVSEANDSDKTLSMQYDVAGLVSSVILARKIVEQEKTIKLQDTRIKELEKIVDDIQKELDKQKL